ncbi:alpha-1,2-fucosyltransferase [Sporomusa sphaeroides]|uniref:Glycosyl transferase family 11 n=1 Tax=Sporomusa sphaeroides DSM 2875 TaxID=1337886 RepID=A0ABM9W441_9FIRM|nr:alpha-1,2-fucosyltransferase [Sporomusa sphaeroides]OLS55530.1 glycosyl transferase family 11 [Sporomusa sphaeroides DSM 2875]CVK19933.1 Glycosyl transferase family 11 [Sporomusa sphaeroides DSM 2875]
MVIVQLNGGLGNQMFQYALGRYLSIKLNTTFKLDTYTFRGDKLRKYELDCFNISEGFATASELAALRLDGWKQKLRVLMGKIGIDKKTIDLTVVRERQFHFDSLVLEMEGNLYLAGYWQSEKYFKAIEDVIRQDFSLKAEMSYESRSLAEEITRNESISLHIRRSDYVTNPEANKVHGVMPIEYYNKAMDYIARNKSDVKYYIFSDCLAWVRHHFSSSSNIVIVDHNDGEHSYEDMILMSICKHNIIANSSFSWWGAWLNQNSKKIVISPEQWFRVKDYDTRDLIPDKWVKL